MDTLVDVIGILIGAAALVCSLALLWWILTKLAIVVLEVNRVFAEAGYKMRRWFYWRGIAIRVWYEDWRNG
jgi:hypothetical protein